MHKDELIYIATPYSSNSPIICEIRFEVVTKYAAQLVKEGHRVFSPITSSHPMSEHNLPKNWSFWEEYDRFYLGISTLLDVLMQPGWDKSVGVANEIRISTENKIPIRYTEYIEQC